MTLDMRTIMVMLLVSSVLMAITLAVGTRMGRAAGFVKWNAGLGLLALGWVLLAGSGALPDLVAIALAYAILVAGLIAVLAGIIEFGGSTAPRLLLIAPGPLMHALLIPMVQDYPAATLLMGVVLVAILAAMAGAAARLGVRAGPARWMLAVASAAGAITVLVRAVDIWLKPAIYTSLFVASNLHAVTFVVLFACTIVIPVEIDIKQLQSESSSRCLFSLPVDPIFYFGKIHLCIDTPLCSQAIGLLQCGSFADENPGRPRVKINALPSQ